MSVQSSGRVPELIRKVNIKSGGRLNYQELIKVLAALKEIS